MLYKVSNLKKQYGDKTILDIDFLEIEAQRIYALMGPNGAGKTTLLSILSFLEAPNAGLVHFRSKEIRFAENNLQPLRKEVVMVDQHPILFTTTVYKNVEFGLKVRKVSLPVRRSIIEETLELVGMLDFMHTPAHRLSGGETQRVALARALVVSPAVLLCDEPTSSVDVKNQQIIIDILKRINEQKNITVLFTTHDSRQVSSLADQTLFLDHGRLVRENE